MPQVLKDEVRGRILGAALEVFAQRGYQGATMSAIAERAGVGAASTYRYFAGKRELFEKLVTPELAERFESLLDRRVHALARAVLAVAPRGADDLGDEMLRFWIENRLAVVILLDRAAGTPFAGFGERFVEQLVASTLAELGARAARHPGGVARTVLTQIFDGTRRTLAVLLEAHPDERTLRDAIEAFWSYQVPGIRGFAGWARGARGAERAPARGRAACRPRRVLDPGVSRC
jgi:AcrR family transcriptional regulator